MKKEGFITRFIKGIVNEVTNQMDKDLALKVEQRTYYNSTSEDYKFLERKAWHSANVNDLLAFYKNAEAPEEVHANNIFYNYIDISEMTPIHSRFGRLLSDTVGVLLFHNGITINNKYDEFMSAMMLDVAKTAAYSGMAAIKFDTTGKYEVFDGSRFKVDEEKEEIQFTSTLVFKQKVYQHRQVYGLGYIMNLLFIRAGSEYREVPLSSTPYTEKLERFISLPYKDLRMACYIKHDSIYEGNVTLFAALDEALSNINDLNRQGKPYTYFTEDHMEIGAKGKKSFNRRKRRFLTLKTSIKENTDRKVEFDQPKVDATSNQTQVDIIKDMILGNCGISKATLGYEQLANISYETRLLQEASSLRTRESLVVVYEPFIQEIYDIMKKVSALATRTLYDSKKDNIVINEYLTEPTKVSPESVIQYVGIGLLDRFQAFKLLKLDERLKEVGVVVDEASLKESVEPVITEEPGAEDE